MNIFINQAGDIDSIRDASSLETSPLAAFYNPVTGIIGSIESPILTYTVPTNRIFFLKFIDVSGTVPGVYTVKINGTALARRRAYYTNYSDQFRFDVENSSSLKLVGGDILVVTIFHKDAVGQDFNATIYGKLE